MLRFYVYVMQNIEGFGDLQYEIIFGFQDLYFVGIVVKKEGSILIKFVGIGKERVFKIRKDSVFQKIEFLG